MKFNKYFIFIIFLMLILSVSAVNAADNMNINDNSSSNLINSRDAISPDSTTVNKNWTVDEFLNNYNTIQDNDVVFIKNGVGTPRENIVLTQNGITIFTEGNVIFDGQNKNFHFEISGKNVLIQGIVFQNFNFVDRGGAIQWNGDKGTLADCQFINNTGQYGGAVYWNGTEGVLDDCKFINNTAVYGGGAVYWYTDMGSLSGCTFLNNIAENDVGGGVLWTGVDGAVAHSNFTNNTSREYGAGIYWRGPDGSLVNCIFDGNNAGNSNGGGVYWNAAGGTVNDCRFTNNRATYGAGLFLYTTAANSRVYGCNFTGNIAVNSAGGVYWQADGGVLTDCRFNNNRCNEGAGVCWNGANGRLTDSIFAKNIAYYGAGVRWYGVIGTVSGCTFNDNYATNAGGGLYWNGANGRLDDSKFVNNTAEDYGGALRWNGADGYLTKGTFINNTVKLGDGGAVFWIGNNGNLTDSIFNNNSAGGSGGGVYFSGSSDILTGCTFNKSTANDYGGAVFWEGEKGTLTNCKFINNTSNQYGGAVNWEGPSGSLSDSDFASNTADYGGAVFWTGNYGNLSDSSFNSNTANNGGALFWTADNGSLTDSSFKSNAASIGGAVYWTADNGSLVNSIFTDNAAAVFGGGIYWDSVNGKIADSTFTSNNANMGGAAYFYSASSMNNCTFANSKWVKSNGIYAQKDLCIDGGNGIVDIVILGTLSDSSTTVLNNKTVYLSPNQNINLTGKVMSGNLTIVDGRADMFKFYVDGVEIKDKTVKISDNGEYYVPYTTNTLATYVISGNYTKANSTSRYKNGTLVVKNDLADPELNVTVEQDTITATLNDQATGQVIIYVNGVEHIQNIVAGKAVLQVPGLSSSSYNVTVIYPGDMNFKSAAVSEEHDADSGYILEAEDVVKYFRNGTQYHVSLKDGNGNPIAGEKITITFVNSNGGNPSKYTIATDGNGIATLTINANPGLYYITATYGNESVTNTVTVLAISCSIDAQDIYMKYNDGTSYTARLTYSDGTPISNVYMSIVLNTKTSSKEYRVLTDGNGVATLAIHLNPGQYSMTAKYMDEEVTTKLVVLSGNYIIMAEDVVKYFKNGTQYAVKVTDLNGNPVVGQKVTVTLNSATWAKPASYTITTDSNGIATIAINLAPGQYTAEATIGSDVVQSNVIVLPTLTSESLTKPVNQPGNLVVKLVDGQGNPASGKTVTFTVKTKTYTKTTDANGIASLPINLGIGTWTITIANPETGAKTTAKVIITQAKI